ncbi:MAG TPA: AsmA family protein [Candidatus Omnitrophota bacterium]|nr:AsmA family protein [Candidatus Omnitrophota bacterium]
MKKYQKILIAVVVILVGLVILKDVLIKTTITTVGSGILGAPIKIKSFAFRAMTQKVHIKGMVVGNPQGFPAGTLVDMPEIRVDFDLGALLKGKLHLPLIIFDLKEVVLIKDKDGNLNVDALKIAQAPGEEAQKKEDAKTDGKSKTMPMQIDELRLNVERVILKDYSQGEKPVILAYELALKDKVFKNIQSPQQMAALIMVQAMGPTAIQGAKIYGAATLLGAAFLPAGVVGVLVGKDSSVAEYGIGYDRLYDASVGLLKEIGALKSEDRASGVIKANVNGNDVAMKIEKTEKQKIKVTISARKMMLPKPEVAGGIQYQISERI